MLPNSTGKEEDKCNLFEWISLHGTEEEKRDVFLNMDIALKYIHNHGYCIEAFYPSCIDVLDEKSDHIYFERLCELSSDPTTRKEEIKKDIFNSSLIQIGIYTNTLKTLTPEFVKEYFDDLSRFLPEGDVPYYRGVVQRGASVYFSEFALEKMNRDLQQLEKEINASEGKKNNETSSDIDKAADDLSNDEINDRIYRQINGSRDAAFINSLIIPTLILISLLLIGMIGWFISLK